MIRVRPKNKKWWWFHKLFKPKTYKACMLMECVASSKENEILKKAREGAKNKMLYGMFLTDEEIKPLLDASKNYFKQEDICQES